MSSNRSVALQRALEKASQARDEAGTAAAAAWADYQAKKDAWNDSVTAEVKAHHEFVQALTSGVRV